MKADKLYLVGFMGAGKTTVGRALAKRLDWRFEDVDERIEKAEGRDVASIFRQSGEPYFRASCLRRRSCARAPFGRQAMSSSSKCDCDMLKVTLGHSFPSRSWAVRYRKPRWTAATIRGPFAT